MGEGWMIIHKYLIFSIYGSSTKPLHSTASIFSFNDKLYVCCGTILYLAYWPVQLFERRLRIDLAGHSFQNQNCCKMQYQKNRLRNLLVGFTLLLLAFFIYTQYRTFLNNITIARKQLQLNTLQGRILYLDEALIMSARTFVLTKDQQWNLRYRKLAAEFYSSISQFYTLFPGPIEGKKELDASMSSLMNMQLKAFDLVHAGRPEAAKSLLFGEEYKKQQEVYASGLKQLTTSLDQAVNGLMEQHYTQAKRTTLIRGIIVILIIFSWTWFNRVSRKWRREIEKVNHKRTEEAIASAEKLKNANDQLQLVSAHLQEVREKERLNLASEINEELGQQIAVMQVRIADIQTSMQDAERSGIAELQQVSGQLDDAMQF